MSFKDAFLAKGLVSKKDVRRVNDESRRQRKESKNKQRKKRALEAEAEAESARAQEKALRERGEARRQREAETTERERVPRVRQIIVSNRVGSRGPYGFFHRAWESARILRINVSEEVAKQLRLGELGVVALDQDTYVVVGKRAIAKLEELDPGRIVFWVEPSTGPTGPADALLSPGQNPEIAPDFRPRRATADDIERLRQRALDSGN